MPNTIDNYNDDEATREALATVGSERTLHEFYGYFFGCMAAPKPALPSQCLPLLFDADKADFSSLEEADSLMADLMSLWNFIARWQPDEEPCCFPETEYAPTNSGFKQRGSDDQAMIQFFIRGLDQGDTKENDFSDDAIDAMHDLEESATLLQKYAGQCAQKDPEAPVDDPERTAALYDELEEVIADSIARVTIGLKEAKARAARKAAAAAKAEKLSRPGTRDRRR
jgi:yecA family protein